MKIFISWSGETSLEVARALRRWLADVFHDVEVWMSDQDIDIGSRWAKELDTELAGTNFGILCLTADNLSAPWLLFEAGSLAKDPTLSQVVPYRFGLTEGEVSPPLSKFQGVGADKEGTWKLVKAINDSRKTPLESDRLKRAFEKWWPDLLRDLQAIDMPAESVPIRDDREILEEILTTVRRLDVVQPAAPTLRKALVGREYLSHRFLLGSIARAKAIARIEVDLKPVATGFLVRGGDLHESLPEQVFLTTAYAITPEPPWDVSEARLRAIEINFEDLERSYRAGQVLFFSPLGELDTAILTLEGDIETEPCPIELTAPRTETEDRQALYMIGHPLGRKLSISMNGTLLRVQIPFVQYQLESDRGSGGSPVFDDEWRVIAIHHATRTSGIGVRRGEGILLGSIAHALDK